ncbi:MAG: glyceraldehyde-3-phosphate dehydrogenase [Myxococcales bacterium]|nr:glyceraldehyde-3-phosphate dehydrogenase [Myxococcales bacterium]
MISAEDAARLRDWNERLDLADSMLPMIGRLYRKHGVLTKIFGRVLINQSPVEIMKLHRFAQRVTGEELTVRDTFAVVRALDELAPRGRLRLDVGKLTVRFRRSGEQDVLAFLKGELAAVEETRLPSLERHQDVVLYGFGRVGRLVARILLDKVTEGQGLMLRAIVVRPGGEGDLVKRASLLRRDSVHGPFRGTINVDEERGCIIANGIAIQVIYAQRPEEVDYTKYGIERAVIIDNTGAWRDAEGLGRHLEAPGAARVLLTAPGKGALPNVVYGINHDSITDDDRILSAASCTTNAIVPVLKVIDDRFGIAHGHVETCHAYTNDQNLIDNFHKKARRGRGAPLNMVLTETGAAKAVAKALPKLAGKLTGNAIRVPTPNVSLAVLSLQLNEETTVEALNESLREESLDGELQLQLDFSYSPDAVSSDFVGNGHASIIDAPSTIVDGKNAVVYVWYDNEHGYSAQVVRLVERISGLRPPTFPR